MAGGPVPENLSPLIEIEGTPHFQPTMEEVRAFGWQLGEAVARSSFEIKYLVAVTRGGLVPAECVSRATGVRDIQTYAVELYTPDATTDGSTEAPGQEMTVWREPELEDEGDGALFVDDVLDTMHTMRSVKAKWPRSASAVIYTKQAHDVTLSVVDFYARYTGDIWIDFPWERETKKREEMRKPPEQTLF